MNIFVDVDLRTAVVSGAQRSPVGTIEVKNQDTIDFNIYFVQGGNVIDLGATAALKFGLVAAGQTTLLVLTTAFTYSHDATGNPYYKGQPVFNTTQMATAMGSNRSILCTGEIRYQQPDGEIIHSLSIPFQVDLTLVPETGATPPTISGTYPDASTLVLISQGNQPGGFPVLDSGSLILDARIPATVERLSNKNQPAGYPGLTAGKLAGSTLPVDGASIGLNGSGQLTVLGSIVANLTDFETSAGASLIHTASGVLNRLVAGTGISFDTTTTPGGIILNVAAGAGVTSLTDAETTSGATLISNASGILKRIAAGANITFDTTTVPGSIIIAAAGGGSSLTLVDAETTAGLTLLGATNGQVKRLIAGTNISLDSATTPGGVIINDTGGSSLTLVDAETSTGSTLLGSTNGQVKRLVAGTNVTLDSATTPGAVIVNSAGGGSSLTLVDAETTAGSTLLGSTNGQVKRLIAGTNLTLDTATTPGGVILNAASGGAAASVFAQIIATGTLTFADATPLSFTAIVTDASGFWSSGQPSRLTVPTGKDGLYLATFNYALYFPAAGLGIGVSISKNGWNGNGPSKVTPAAAIGGCTDCLTGLMQLAAGDYINCVGWTNWAAGGGGNAPSSWSVVSAAAGSNSNGVGPVPMLTLVKVA